MLCSNAAWVPHQRRPLEGAKGRFTIGLLGRLTSAKGLDLILDTFRGLLEHDIDAELMLAGECGDASDRAKLESGRSEFGDRMRTFGSVVGSTKNDFFASLDAFVFPTCYLHEAEPLVILEALSAGLPVITFGRGCIGEMVPPAAGLVVDPNQGFVETALPYLLDLARGAVSEEAVRQSAIRAFEEQAARAMLERERLVAALTKTGRL